jgi:hypothetical protein
LLLRNLNRVQQAFESAIFFLRVPLTIVAHSVCRNVASARVLLAVEFQLLDSAFPITLSSA